MAKLDSDKRKEMVETIRVLYLKGMRNCDVKKAVKQIFNVDYSTKCLVYYKEKAFREEWKEVLEGQNKVIDSWNNAEDSTKPSVEENLAEAIYEAVSLADPEKYDNLVNYNETIKQIVR